MRRFFVSILFITITACNYGQFINGVVASSHVGSNPELITNGVFSVDANWTKSGYTTITGGEAVLNVGASYDESLSQTINLVLNQTYVIEFDITNYTSGAVLILFGNLSTYCTLNNIAHTANGHYSHELVYDNASAAKALLFYCLTSQPHLHIDNVSVKLK